MFGKDSKSESGITLVATNCEVEGDLHFSDQLIVNGIVKGNIYAQAGSKATVTISEKGQVRGEIRVPNVIVNGKVFGDIRSDRHIELATRAEVKGNIYYHLIEMVKGSKVDGHLVHLQDGKVENSGPVSARADDQSDEDASVARVSAVKSKSA